MNRKFALLIALTLAIAYTALFAWRKFVLLYEWSDGDLTRATIFVAACLIICALEDRK